MTRLKMVSAEKLKSREWRRQEAELRVRCEALDRVTRLGMPQSEAV